MVHDWIADAIALAAFMVAAFPVAIAALRPAKLLINIQQYCTLAHYCGHPQLFVFIDIHNIGSRTTTISSIDVKLERDDKRWDLAAKTYVAQDFVARLGALLGERREMLVGSITLAPNEHWRESVDAYEYPSHADEKILNELVASMDEQITEKRGQLPDPNSKELVEVSDDLAREAMAYFNNHFALNAGNYKITAAVRFSDGRKAATRSYSFTLWDRPAKELRDISDRYKYGITYAHSKAMTFSVRLSPAG